MTRFLALLALAGCAVSEPAITPKLAVIQFATPAEIDVQARQVGLKDGARGLWVGGSNPCLIMAPPPRSRDDAERWGTLFHELRHCQDGAYHP